MVVPWRPAIAQETFVERDAAVETLIKPIANLTKEQLQNWAVEHDPLELLAIRKQTSFVTCMAAIPSANSFIVAGRHVTLWSTQKSEPEHVFDWPWVPNNYMVAMAVSPDGKWFVTADCLDRQVRPTGARHPTITRAKVNAKHVKAFKKLAE